MKQNLNYMPKSKHLHAKIEALRREMYDADFINGYLLDNKTVRVSKNLDEVINEYIKSEKN